MRIDLSDFLFISGLAHFSQVPAMISAPKVLGWKEDLSKLLPINRWIFKIISGGIMLCVLGTGVVVMISSRDLAMGGTLASAFLGFLSVFWTYRASVQIFLYSKIWPSGFAGRASHYSLAILFSWFTFIYWYSFLKSVFG